MTDIKFIGTNQVELINSLSENKISPVSSGENFIEFSFDSLSKDNKNYYHFAITGSNVQVSGTIGEVTSDFQYFSLFSGQTAITNAENLTLSSTTAKKFCYANMFLDCTNLTTPPTISATTLAEWCYSSMFGNCSSLTATPTLLATTLAKYCYYCMFYGCKSLSSAPYLSAQTLQDWCYNSMFYNCSNLTSISADFTSWGENATTNWVTGIKTEGNFTNTVIEPFFDVDHIPVSWRKHYYQNLPITFKSIGNTTVSAPHQTLYFKKNSYTWSYYTAGEHVDLADGETVSFSGNTNNNKLFTVTGNGTAIVYGNPHSIINYNGLSNDTFKNMFSGCTKLVDASNLILSSMTLSNECYKGMFYGCNSLTAAPQLPATNLALSCYAWMFFGCSSLIDTPVLYATDLTEYCYRNMFEKCTSLTGTTQLPATTLTGDCYAGMFKDCTSLVKAPSILATTLSPYCSQAMFAGCTSLVEAPVLLATTVKDYCYSQMFKNCTSLKIAPVLFATNLANGCYSEMFRGCSSLNKVEVNFTTWDQYTTTNWLQNVASTGEFTCPTALDTTVRSVSRVPYNWTIVEK